jgi:transposase
MQVITTVGLDIAKSVFQVHGIDAEGNVIVRRRLVRLIPTAYVKRQARYCSSVEKHTH